MAIKNVEKKDVITEEVEDEVVEKTTTEDKTPKTLSNSEYLDYIKVLQEYRKNFEPNWYRSHHAYENNCFVAYSRATQSIVKIPYRKRFFLSVPEIKKQCDAFENNLLQFMPLFVVYPDDVSDEKAREDSKYLSKLLKKHYIDWDSKNLVHKYLHNAIKYPISFWEIGVENRTNPLTGKTQKMVVPSVSDAFDWLFDPHIPFNENPIVIKKIKRNLKDIKEYKDYKAPTVAGSAPDDLKEMIFNDKYGNRKSPEALKTQFVYQIFEKLSGGIKETIIDAKGATLRSKWYEGATDYPVVPLSLFSDDEYSPSFCENLIPINRSINLIINRIEEFIHKFAKGAFLVRDGSDISFSDENGVIVKYEGDQPTVMDMPQLPPAIITWLNKLFDISERYGLNEVALGLTQDGSQNRTAKQGAQALQNAQVQQKTPLDNMIQAFTRIAHITIYYLSEFTDEPTNFSFRADGERFETKKFIGEKYSAKDPAAIRIPHSIKSMEVEIEDVSAASIYNKRRELLGIAKEWANIPPVFQEALLDLYKVGNTADLLEAMERNKTMLDNPEFQNIVEQMRTGNVAPEVKNAFAIFLDWLSQQSPTPSVEEMGVTSNVAAIPAPQEQMPAESGKGQMTPEEVRAKMRAMIGGGEVKKPVAKKAKSKPRFAKKAK